MVGSSLLLAWVAALSAPAFAAEGGCTKTTVGRLAKVEQPAVLVLGERKGTLPDLSRAARLVRKLLKKGPVTVALQAVPASEQATLDQYARGGLSIEVLPERLAWQDTWGFPFDAYERLIGTGRQGAKLVAIGARYEPRPPEASAQVPPGYARLLEEPMGENPVPVELEARYAAFVAWADHRFARTALDGWDGKGVLVIVVDRFHVEGGMGVAWQARSMTSTPVEAVLLADAETACYPGDLVLR